MPFDILSDIQEIEMIASGRGVRNKKRLDRVYGQGRWRKMKGIAIIELADGALCEAELHWYEAQNIGRREFKIKRILKWLK